MSYFHTWKTTINHHITILQTKSQRQVVDVQIQNPAQSRHQSGSASHAPPPSKGLGSPTQILESTPEVYYMDVDGDFLEPSHESMEVNSAQPNIVAGPSQMTVSLSNKRPAQHPNCLQRESEQESDAGNALGQNVGAVRQRHTAKTHVMTATE